MENEIRQYCEYCHGNTFTDRRGNCAACGAQKKAGLTIDKVYEAYVNGCAYHAGTFLDRRMSCSTLTELPKLIRVE